MGLFSETVTYRQYILAPVLGDTYNYTSRYGVKTHKTPLANRMTKELLQYHADGMTNIENMKAQLKDLREIHTLPMLRKTSAFKSVNQDIELLSIEKIESVYKKRVIDTSTLNTSSLASDYIEQESNGEYNSILDLQGILDKYILSYIKEKQKDYINDPEVISIRDNNLIRQTFGNLFLGWTIPPINPQIAYIEDIDLRYLGNNKYSCRVDLIELLSVYPNAGFLRNMMRDKVFNFELTLPSYIINIIELIFAKESLFIQFEDESVIFIKDEEINKFYTEAKNKIEFSANIGLRGYSYSSKDWKYVDLALQRLGYKELKNKKRHRQEKLYESVQKASGDLRQCGIGLYMDLYPFKSAAYRNDRTWQLYLKGVMKYFCKITGINSQSTGMGSLFVRLPGMAQGVSTAFTMDIQVTKEKLETKPNGICWFEYKNEKPKVNYSMAYYGNSIYQKIKNTSKSVWLYLVTDNGDGTYTKYGINYSKFHDGLSDSNNYSVIFAKDSIFENLNNTFVANINNLLDTKMNISLKREYRGKPYVNIVDTSSQNTSSSSNSNAFSKFFLFSRFMPKWWEDTNDRVVNKISWESDGAEGSVDYLDLHPRLPMPIVCWNMIPYKAKLTAFTSALLLNEYIKFDVEESTGLGEFLSVVLIVVSVVITVASTGFGSPLASVISSTAIAGGVVGVAGTILENNTLSMIGTVLTSITGIMGGINSGLSSFTDYAKLASDVVGMTNSVISYMQTTNLEDAFADMENKMKKDNDYMKTQSRERIDKNGGIRKTSSAADEEFDQYMFLVSQELLASAIEKSSDNFDNEHNQNKYDNTRVY